ncbi:cytochrome b/b6 domain-containing protein [Litoreibacter roseus]|nr:cytochrome b/b6 domain-containing protein [Litoreibacter roseus]
MLTNSRSTYGGVTKTFHWLTALLILTLIPLGIYANGLPYETGEQLAFKAQVFSIHKTLGVTVFFVALTRILWAISQPKPAPLHGDQKVQHFLAETVHWLLYASLIVVPLSGWIHHAATTGFAPIWWPFGQSLPFVPKDDGLAHTFASLHIIFERVLLVAFLLHFAGAMKHHVIDKDATLRRMLPGRTEPSAELAMPKSSMLPVVGALGAYAVALVIGSSLGLFASKDADAPAVPTLAAVETGWQVTDGTLGISVTQLGSAVEGGFEDWTAAINFSEEADADGRHGDVEVTISIPSLTLGSVTSQALEPDFFDANSFQTATFTADIMADGEAYVAEGTLTLKGSTQPVTLPFTLTIDGDTATMSGQTQLNRTNYNIGESYPDESSVAFPVDVTVNLTAVRQE